jgi:hypothetical protein
MAWTQSAVTVWDCQIQLASAAAAAAAAAAG